MLEPDPLRRLSNEVGGIWSRLAWPLRKRVRNALIRPGWVPEMAFILRLVQPSACARLRHDVFRGAQLKS